MKFENIGIIGAGPNCVFTLDILIKKFLKINQITSRLKLLFMKKVVILDQVMFIPKIVQKLTFK